MFPDTISSKREISPWRTVGYTPADTLEMPLDEDLYARHFIESLSEQRYSPSWLEQKLELPNGDKSEVPALQSKLYGCSPSYTYVDSKSRVIHRTKEPKCWENQVRANNLRPYRQIFTGS